MVSTFQTVRIKQYSAYQMKVIPTGISEIVQTEVLHSRKAIQYYDIKMNEEIS